MQSLIFRFAFRLHFSAPDEKDLKTEFERHISDTPSN
jgi:hypothetical protein